MSKNLTKTIFWNFNEIHERNILSGLPSLKLPSLTNLEITDGRRKGAIRINETSINLGVYPSCISQNQENNNWCPYGVTIDFWVKFETVPSSASLVLGNAHLNSSNEGFAIYNDAGKLKVYLFKSSGSILYTAGTIVPNYWYNILLVYDPYIGGYMVSTILLLPNRKEKVKLLNFFSERTLLSRNIQR